MVIYTDAGTRKNGLPGQSSRICVHSEYQLILDKIIGNYSNNEAELTAIVFGLNQGATEIKTDSQIAKSWITNGWTKHREKSFRKGRLTERHKKMIEKAHTLWLLVACPPITWISRDFNKAGHYLETKYGI